MGSSLTGVTALCSWVRHIYRSLVPVHIKNTRPYITERLLMGHKGSNQMANAKNSTCNLYSCNGSIMKIFIA